MPAKRRATRKAKAEATADEEEVPMETDEGTPKEEEEEEETAAAADSNGAGAGGILLSGADEPEDEEEEEDGAAGAAAGGAIGGPAAAAPVYNTADHPYHLIPAILTPSPFAHHNSSDRYRSALARVQSAPLTDVEAWSAILTEASASYRGLLPNLHYLTSPSLASGAVPPPSVAASTAELEAKLDWIESCHGALLSAFPYSAAYAVSVAEMLLGQTALPGEEGLVGMPPLPPSFPPPHEGMLTDRQRRCQDKLERIFTVGLGVTDLDGTGKGDGNGNGNGNDADNGKDDGTDPFAKSTTDLVGGILSPSAELWLLYVKYVTRRAARIANVAHPPSAGGAAASARAESIRDRTTTAYETALACGGAFSLNNHLVWSAYLTFVKGWEGQATASAPDGTVTTDHALLQKRLSHLRRLYQRLVGHPMTGLDQYWTEYEAYEKNQGGTGAEQLAAALLAEHQPRYQHARSVYLERNRICDLRNAPTSLGVGRLAVPPVEPPRRRGKGGMAVADADGKVTVVAGTVPKKGGAAGEDGAGGAAAAADGTDDDDAVDKMAQYESSLEEELTLLSRWTTRMSYERTNPERLAAADLTRRVRSVYKEFVSCFARHPETWDGWSAWEFLHSASSDGGSSRKLAGKVLRRRAAMADAVLQLGMTNVPTSALLVIQRAEILEQCGSGSGGGGKSLDDDGGSGDKAGADAAIDLLSSYAKEHPTTLVFVCLQKMVRKYKGISAARAVFSRARKELKMRPEDYAEELVAAAVDADGDAVGSTANVVSENENGDKTDDNGGAKKAVMSLAGNAGGAMEGRMVTTRLAPSVGVGSAATLVGSGDATSSEDAVTAVVHRGVITHHLYSSHADIERYLNSSPHVAARVYELGLRRHRSFLTVSSYVLAYANLLLELGDWSNLRGLLARSVGACEEDLANAVGADGVTASRDADKSKTADSADSQSSATKARREASRPLWDAYLRIESLISSVSGSGDVESVRNVEARRRRALYGPKSSTSRAADGDQAEDVASGAYSVVEGSQHSNLADTLVRTDGYDASSRIANGLGRLVDSLEVCGLMGSGLGSSGAKALLGSGGSAASSLSESTSAAAGNIASDGLAGGPADAGIKRRLAHVQRREAMATLASITGGAMLGSAGLGVVGAGAVGGGAAALRARDRLMQQQATAAQANAAATIAPGSPEWLRLLILHLPRVPPHRLGQRPPPHLIEMALASLKSNDLPAERPVDPVPTADMGVPGMSAVDASAPSDPRKRKRGPGGGGGGDSSDEENGGGASGYGSQFRARQRQRMMSG